ncbi:hypothetical protein tinsulaeT_38870 [Thalassotalea insulae]|uniref:Uncharacterized protein n=1 Tax=Thalassotalea insulae TaxID=2056778 RepID=A0ABQ6GXG4_9GAMM|nr:hypothetical protein [Thalassotalea insulae]GLX80547.1 hypothetical protein tinsulaeT_38870 [Thalassotalea insulae]
MKKLCVICALLLNSFIVNAASGSSNGKISAIRFYEGHTGVLIIQENMSDLGECGRADYYILDESHSYFKEIYSLILSSHMTNHPLYLEIDGCIEGISRIKHVRSVKQS